MSELFFNSPHLAASSENIIELVELIGSGNDRDCWRLPFNESLCVKVAKPEQERPQNEIDFHYAMHLKKKKISSPHIPKVYGWILTSKGVGLVFDLIKNQDGQTSKPILSALKEGQVSLSIANELVTEAFDWLIAKKVILADYGINNLLVQNYGVDKFRLVIVDGLGARNLSWNYWVNRTFGFKAVIKAKEFRAKTLNIIKKEMSQS